MELKYKFTAEERALLTTRYNAFLEATKVIAELHGLTGALSVAPDLSGFLSDVPHTQGMVHADAAAFQGQGVLRRGETSQGTSESV